MARTIYFPDGTREVLCAGDDEKTTLEKIIRERLGEDVMELFQEVIEPMEAYGHDDYELACDSYRNCLHDVQNGLVRCERLLDQPRVDKKKVKNKIQDLIRIINNEL